MTAGTHEYHCYKGSTMLYTTNQLNILYVIDVLVGVILCIPTISQKTPYNKYLIEVCAHLLIGMCKYVFCRWNSQQCFTV